MTKSVVCWPANELADDVSRFPVCQCVLLQVLGSKKKTLAGFSTATARPHQGFIWNSEVIQQTPPAFRNKASRLVGAKCTLLARMDAYGQDPSGQAGDAMKVCMYYNACLLACAPTCSCISGHPHAYQEMLLLGWCQHAHAYQDMLALILSACSYMLVYDPKTVILVPSACYEHQCEDRARYDENVTKGVSKHISLQLLVSIVLRAARCINHLSMWKLNVHTLNLKQGQCSTAHTLAALMCCTHSLHIKPRA